MANAAKKIEPEVAYQAVGRIERVQGALYTVSSGNAEYQARRATSCLIEPVEDDCVLLSIVPERGIYVLAVLERQGELTRLAFDGDLEMRVPNGRFVVAAKDGIDLVSTADIGVVADGFKLTTRTAEIVLEHLGVVGTTIQAQVKKAKIVAESIDQAADRLTQRLKRAYRFVSEIEQVRAQRIDVAAEKTMNLHAQNAVVTAEELVKVDGGQIHLG